MPFLPAPFVAPLGLGVLVAPHALVVAAPGALLLVGGAIGALAALQGLVGAAAPSPLPAPVVVVAGIADLVWVAIDNRGGCARGDFVLALPLWADFLADLALSFRGGEVPALAQIPARP